MLTKTELIYYTNQRIESWYKLAKESFNVDGMGIAMIEDDEFKILYQENGKEKVFKAYFCEDYLNDLPRTIFITAGLKQSIKGMSIEKLSPEFIDKFQEGDRVILEVMGRTRILSASTHYIYIDEVGDKCIDNQGFSVKLKDISNKHTLTKL
ncbi:hypothetical protein [Tenacibaculum phage Larrie]|nr:hypothetical protein [Tenacibaculum phage Larrie]